MSNEPTRQEEVIARDGRTAYEPPRVLRLGDLDNGEGCSCDGHGSSATDCNAHGCAASVRSGGCICNGNSHGWPPPKPPYRPPHHCNHPGPYWPW
jgi:hypothetical protein